MDQYMSPRREAREADRRQEQSSPPSTPQRTHNAFRSYSDEETESDEEAFHGSDASVDLLLFASIETYVLSVQSTEMASTSCIGSPSSYSHIMYYPTTLPRTSTPERTLAGDAPNSLGEDNIHSISEIPPLSDEDNVSINSTFPRDLTNISTTVTTEFPPTQRTFSISRGKTFSIRRILSTPEPSPPRRCLRTIPRMQPPSNLATQVANRVIKYARCIRNTYEKDMCCLNCGLVPVCPVTGQCGHTRCTKCIEDQSICPCGNYSPEPLYVNILIRDLIGKTTSDGHSSSTASDASSITTEPAGASTTSTEIPDEPSSSASGSCTGPIRHRRKVRASSTTPYSGCTQRTPIPMSPRLRFNHAVELLEAGRYREAAPHLALAAASADSDLQPARGLLAQAITVASKDRDPRSMMRQLNRMIRHLSSTSWIKPTDLECILCCDTFTNPVTTPCGHMFCRTCIERTMDYKKRCPLCLRPLIDFKLAETRNTVFVQAALKTINAVNIPPPPEPDLIPIFVCTVAYPSVPCPLFIFDPRYWLMIRRVLESGSRRFGMVACDRTQDYVDYGTILEVRDCVHLEDGRSILSTIGLSRFKVIERGVRDGCEVARILPIKDVTPADDMEVWDLKMLATQVMFKALMWLNRLNNKVLADIEAAFGRLPSHGDSEDWWESTDGPSWLWWLVAVLPLRSEIKVLILSTNCLLKRMMAVSRTLEAVDQVTLRNAAPSECAIPNSTNNQAMERGS